MWRKLLGRGLGVEFLQGQMPFVLPGISIGLVRGLEWGRDVGRWLRASRTEGGVRLPQDTSALSFGGEALIS